MRSLLLLAPALLALACTIPDDDTAAPPAEPSAPASLAPPELLPALDLSPFEAAVGARMRGVGATLVEIETMHGDELRSHGSGVLVSATGHVLTAAHVVRNATHLTAVLPDGERRAAIVVARDDARDAALLHAPGAPTAFATLDAARPAAGAWVVCAGHGGQVAEEHVAMRTAGVVIEPSYLWTVHEYDPNARHPVVRSSSTHPHMLRLDCATAPGMSGGPVVDLAGNVVGLVVGSDGVATPVALLQHLVARIPAGARAAARASSSTEAPSAIDADGRASRQTAISASLGIGDVARSLVELEVPGGFAGPARFDAVLVSEDGLAIAPAVRVPGGADPAASIKVVDHAGASCAEIVAVRGELALLRLAGLPIAGDDADALDERLRPARAPGVVELGAIVTGVEHAGGPAVAGFVTALDRHPGRVAPHGPRWGCGLVRGHFYAANPAVDVGSALAHDAGWPRFGSVLVDRRGRPVAIAVANRAPGLAFAVPWREALMRFADWVSPPRAPLQ